MVQMKPFFPLDIFLLPGEFFQLHIFEPRYKSLMRDVLCGDKCFGIPFFNPINADNIGSWVEIVEVFNENPLGEMDIVVQCLQNFRVEQYSQKISEEKPYPGGRLKMYKKIHNLPAPPAISERFRSYLIDSRQADAHWMNHQPGILDIMIALNPNVQNRLSFFQKNKDEERLIFLESYLSYMELISKQEESVYNNFYLN
ncbi:MAG: LON peptidase substrate-binding domain-containing protein [Cryomorphaceae bacterium]|nr:LON peptidase substrate-binding domain-containing protein [Cryomorphaceae bacterium]